MEENRTNVEQDWEYRGTARFDRIIFFNPVSKYTVASYKTPDQLVPETARSSYHYRDHLIRFTAVGYDLPQTDAVEVVLEGLWKDGKYGLQLSVEQWQEIVPRTTDGIKGYLASGLLKGIGEKTAAAIVERFGLETLDILEEQPERLLEIKGITEERLADIKTSYAESRMLRDLMTLLSPYKVTPVTAQKIYQHFGIGCLDILQKSPFRLCEISGFGFKRVDAIVQKLGGRLDDPMRIQGALRYTMTESKNSGGHLFMEQADLLDEAHTLLNETIPLIQLRVPAEKVEEQYQAMVLHGDLVASKGSVYLPQVFALEDETARKVAEILTESPPGGAYRFYSEPSQTAAGPSALGKTGAGGGNRVSPQSLYHYRRPRYRQDDRAENHPDRLPKAPCERQDTAGSAHRAGQQADGGKYGVFERKDPAQCAPAWQ